VGAPVRLRQPTGVDLPGEEGGIVLRPEHYSGSSMGNMPIGQGIAVTPMQMATAYTAIANHGVMRRPYIVKGDQPPPKRVLTPRTAEQVSHMLEGVLGRAARRRRRRSRATRWPARPAPREGDQGRLLEDRLHRVVHRLRAGEDPRLLVAVMVDTPRGDIYGGTVAAPAFERIMEFALPYLKIPPS
jgi:cell division protein FtsI/penicillin-binding protein 2